MITKQFWAILTIAMIAMLPGCSATRQMMGVVASPELVAESLETMPPDAAVVARAIGNRLGGDALPAAVRLEPAVDRVLNTYPGIEPGFRVRSANLCQYTKTGTGSAARRAAGRLELQDGLGRTAAVTFEADYDTGPRTVVKKVRITPLFDTPPEAICFVVPAQAARLDKGNLPRSFAAFYQYMGERALSPQAVVPGGASDYVMAVFFLNRMSPSAKASLAVSSTPAGIQGYAKDSRYADYNGWRVGLVAGRLALKNPQSTSSVYLKAVYTPGKEAGFFKIAKLVGVYALAQRE